VQHVKYYWTSRWIHSRRFVESYNSGHTVARYRGVARILHWGGRRSWAQKARESKRRRRRGERGLSPPQPTRRYGRSSWAPPTGSGAEPRPPTLFGIFKAHRTLPVERTVLLYWIMYKAQKAKFSCEILGNINTYIPTSDFWDRPHVPCP